MFTPNFVTDRKYILVSLPAAQSFREGTRVACSFFAADTAATTGDTQTALQPTRHGTSPSFGGHGCHYKRPSGRVDLSNGGGLVGTVFLLFSDFKGKLHPPRP